MTILKMGVQYTHLRTLNKSIQCQYINNITPPKVCHVLLLDITQIKVLCGSVFKTLHFFPTGQLRAFRRLITGI